MQLSVAADQLVSIDIVLGRSNGVYRPGDRLTGHVIIDAKQDVPLCGVYLWILGQADVMLADAGPSAKTAFDYEIYMKECHVLWGQEETRPNPHVSDAGSSVSRLLTAGVHRFNFAHNLPTSLPSSFESHVDHSRRRVASYHHHHRQQQSQQQRKDELRIKASVRYVVRAKLDSTNASLRQMCRDCGFVVSRPLDLNQISPLDSGTPRHWTSAAAAYVDDQLPPVDESVRVDAEAMPCWCPCQRGVVSCSLKLDRRAFVPGEDISVAVDIQNASRKEITSSYVAMTQIVHVRSDTSEHSSECDIFCISGGKVKAGDNAFYHDIIHIPPLPPSRLDGCNIIDVDYAIKLGVMLAGSSTSVLDLTLPIVIGTQPLKQTLVPGLQMSPNYQRYNQSSGEIENYGSDEFARGRCRDVYVYYRCTYSHQTMTSSSAANGNATLIT